MLKLKRKKTGDRTYDLVDTKTGIAIATASQTGEHGRDHYPWEWNFHEDRLFGNLAVRTTGSFESLRDIVDHVETAANASGIIRLTDDYVSGYDVEEGQYFRYGFHPYHATAKATGDFNAYVKALDFANKESEVRIAHSDSVRLYRVEFAPAK